MEILKAMDELAKLNEKAGKGTTKVQGGKIYTNVSTRVEAFRKHLGLEYGIETAPLFPATGGVLMQAWVKDLNGNIIGTGHAFANSVSKEKGIEKLETTAIGRALASIGLAGGEYASDTEMETWPERYAKPEGMMTTEEVTPESWLEHKIMNIEEFITKPKSTLAKLYVGDGVTRKDPMFATLNDGQVKEYEEAIKQADFKLQEKS